jgi:glycosyltransferase involved in cell wall biosynthesis
MSKAEISFVIPAYNEENTINDALQLLDNALSNTNSLYEIVVVDDGSSDNTQNKALLYASKNGHVKVIGLGKNEGKGFAVRRGFKQANGDSVIFVDSDMEIEINKIMAYIEALNQGDIVIASKWHPESRIKIPLMRRVLGHGFNLLVRLFTGVKLKDTQTGLKAMKKAAFDKIFPKLSVKRYAFDVELLVLANLYGLRIKEMPVNIKLGSKFSLLDVWRMFLDLLGITYRLRVLRWYQRGQK